MKVTVKYGLISFIFNFIVALAICFIWSKLFGEWDFSKELGSAIFLALIFAAVDIAMFYTDLNDLGVINDPHHNLYDFYDYKLETDLSLAEIDKMLEQIPSKRKFIANLQTPHLYIDKTSFWPKKANANAIMIESNKMENGKTLMVFSAIKGRSLLGLRKIRDAVAIKYLVDKIKTYESE